MNGMEVATAVNYDVPVIGIVHNNAKLGLVHKLQKVTLGEKYKFSKPLSKKMFQYIEIKIGVRRLYASLCNP